jgi:hypothetical protein
LLRVTDRLTALTDLAHKRAAEITGNERLAAELAELLMHWLIHGKPAKNS